MTAPRTEAEIARSPLTLGGTVAVLVPAALKALVETAVLVAAVVLVVAFSNDWDVPWLYWGVAAGLLPFAVMPRTFTVLSRAGVGTPHRWGVLVVVVAMLALCGALAGVVGALLSRAVTPPPELGAGAWELALFVFACGLWSAFWLLVLLFFWGFTRALGVLVSVMVCLVAGLGMVAPALLPHLGTSAAVALATASPVVLLPALVLLMAVLPVGRLSEVGL